VCIEAIVCGIIGIHGPNNVAVEMYYGLLALQHRGQSSVGMITYDGNIYPDKDAGLVTQLTKKYEDLNKFEDNHPGPIGIGHTRYSTSGRDDSSSLKRNAQPEYIVNPFVASCHNGNIYNGRDILPVCQKSPRTACDIQYLLLPMSQNLPSHVHLDFDHIVEAGKAVMDILKGSYSALFLTAGKSRPFLVAMTDPYKVRPMVIGSARDTWYIASESVVLSRLGVKKFQDVDSGSILTVTPGEDKPEIKKVCKKKKCMCMFEYIYFADPASWIEKVSVHKVRVNLGKCLGKECPVKADIVVPVPESGRRYGIGFANETGIPLEEGLKKDRKERAFIMQTQQQRDTLAETNITAVDAAIDGKEVVITDDSLIRGTNISRVIRKLREAGAKKVHVRIGCPPVVGPCYLGIDMRSKLEFIAVDHEKNELRSWDDIAKDIGADSLGYSSLKALKSAIKGSSDDFDLCTGCLDFPGGYPADMRKEVEDLYNKSGDGMRAYEC
jgi:amidophosphoribosyltransferase